MFVMTRRKISVNKFSLMYPNCVCGNSTSPHPKNLCRCRTKRLICSNPKCDKEFCQSCYSSGDVDDILTKPFRDHDISVPIGFITHAFNIACEIYTHLESRLDPSPDDTMATSLIMSFFCYIFGIQDQTILN